MLWTAASIYAYTYLWISYVFVQGNSQLPDYTDRFPWEVLLSAGTTVVSQASKGIVGTKGGGPIRPQLSDLISAGGSVAPGRVQFFSWTLVSIGAYLTSVLTTDPSHIHVLPNVPNGLLSISGISAGAYLGARAVSAPGPTLSLAKFVDKADGEGKLGADDGEGGPFDGDDVDHLVKVAGIDRHAAGELGNAAVARSAEDFGDLRRFAERPD